MARYSYYTNGNKVYCVSSFAGKRVRGTASCHPRDDFNLEDGKKIATLRCDDKVAIKRVKIAQRRLVDAQSALENARRDFEKANNSYIKSMEGAIEARTSLNSFLNKF